ncbi:HD domain-containing protein [Paenibacillus harenae]|uniref:HD domain-containing protein n=1 Tax=Paenibacillus harenae TaxID=306543 RepID=UPI00278D917F|nr:HD domain-containing protein [Paenibacillus harenae]MDQ0064104.1 (p)ppGpp synthase/HD superfamily hydrolase [Paenibacillus harenae]
MELIQKAIDVAALAHKNQVRKGTKLPYISHPYGVGMMLMQAQCEPEIVAAGILHDTLEDTEVTEEELLEIFGRRVTEIVIGCSEPDKTKSWEERKSHTIAYMRSASLPIRMVSCADKIHNIRSTRAAIDAEGEKAWERFKRGRDKQEWYHRSMIESLGYQSSFPLLEVLVREVNALYGSGHKGE